MQEEGVKRLKGQGQEKLMRNCKVCFRRTRVSDLCRAQMVSTYWHVLNVPSVSGQPLPVYPDSHSF